MKRAVRATVAFVVLAAFTIGMPAFLVRAVGNPWPGRLAFQIRNDHALIVAGLAVVCWLAWARLVVAVVTETVRAVRWYHSQPHPEHLTNPTAPNGLPAGGGAVGPLVFRLVVAILVVLPTVSRATPARATVASTDPLTRPPAVTRTVTSPERSAPDTTPAAASTAPVVAVAVEGERALVTVAAGDTLRGLARDHLGDPDRWRELFDLNRHRPQPDGQQLTSPSMIRPGWTLQLPTPPTAAASTPASSPASAGDRAATVIVQPGDTLWGLIEQTRGTVDPAAVAEIAALNDGTSSPDGHRFNAATANLINPGEQFSIPAQPVPAGSPQTVGTAADASTTPAPATGGGVEVAATGWRTAPGDTYTTIAMTVTGDASRASDIATLNGAPSAATAITVGTIVALPANILAVLIPADRAVPLDDTAAGLTTAPPREPWAPPAPAAPTPPDATTPPALTTASTPAATAAPATAAAASAPGPVTATTATATGDGSSLRPAVTTDTRHDAFPLSGAVGGATIAAGIVALIESRRRLRARRRRQYHAADPTRLPEHVVDELALRSLAALSHRARAVGVAALIDAAYRSGHVPRSALVQTVEIGDDGPAVVTFDEPVTEMPDGWEPLDDGRWQTSTAGPPALGLPRLVRLLCPIGRTDTSEVFVDLQTVGAVTVTGDPDRVRAFLTGLVEHATQLIDGVELDLYSDLPCVARYQPGGQIHTHTIPDDLAARIVHERGALWAALEAKDVESVLHAQLADPTGFLELVPVIVVAAQSPVDPRVCGYAADGTRAVSVISTSPGGTTSWLIDDRGLHLPAFTVNYPPLLDDRSLDAVSALVTAEPDEPDPVLTIVSAPPVADPGPYREPDWEWMVRLLGRKVVVVDRADDKIVFVTETNRNGQLAPELLAFLSFRTDRSAAVDEIRDALWAAKITANLKKTAGLNPAEREQARRRGDGLVSEETARRLARAARQYLRDDVLVYDGGLWTLGPQVVTDIALLEHRLDYAQIAPADVAWPVLRDALAQISAVPFADSALEVWADASHTTMRVHEVIGEAGVVAAQLALELGRYDDGLWACDQAQIANPINEQVEVLAYDLEAARHNFDGIRHRYQAMITRLDAIHDEPDPATQSRYNKYMLRRSAG